MENLWQSTISETDFREYDCETNHGIMYVRFSKSPSGINHTEIGTRESRAYAFTITRVTGENDTRWINPKLAWLLREHRLELYALPDDEISRLIDIPRLICELGQD